MRYVKLFEEQSAGHKYTPETAKDCPKSSTKKVYDTDDNVLFGSRMVKGKVAYIYVPGELMASGVPYIIGSEVAYDGKGNSDLPKDAEIMAYEDLHKKFTDNKFGTNESLEEINEGNLESLQMVLNGLKNATEEEVEKICRLINSRLTWATIYDMAKVVGIQDKIHK
jgi:hypothetical protein